MHRNRSASVAIPARGRSSLKGLNPGSSINEIIVRSSRLILFYLFLTFRLPIRQPLSVFDNGCRIGSRNVRNK